MGMHKYLAIAVLAIAVAVAAGCGGDHGPVGPTGFTVYPDSVEVAQNSTVELSIRMVNSPQATPPAGFQMTIRYDDSKLELTNGVAWVHPGNVVPASPNRIVAKSVSASGEIRVAMLGWSQGENEIMDLVTSNTQLLLLEFRAVGAPGPTTIEIDDSADAPTPLQLWTKEATQITSGPTVLPGMVTIQ